MKNYLKISEDILNAMKLDSRLSLKPLMEEIAVQLIYLSDKSLTDGNTTLSFECPNPQKWNAIYSTDCLKKRISDEQRSYLIAAFVNVFTRQFSDPTEIKNICPVLQTIKA